MRPHDSEDSRHNIDWFIFIGTATMVVAVCLPLILFPGPGGEVAMGAFRFITAQFGFAYLWSATAALAFLAWLALGPYGRVHLGPEGSSPEFSTFSWAAMLFCGGIGATLLYWGTIEWVYYYEAPPFGEVPGTEAALEWASSYPIYHWGITGWALYCIPAVAMAHAYHVRNISSLRMSAACRPTIGKHADGHLGRLIDLTFMVGIVGGSATGVGFSAPLITASISHFADVPEEDYMTLLAVFLGTALFATSVYAGLERGIRRLSNINAGLAIGFLVFIFVAGPTLFILTESTKAVLFMARNFVQMTIWGDPLATTEFTRAWTVFYWAWWIAMAPYMGIFISKISRGRTIRQLIFGVVGFGSLGCTAFFCVLGNYAVFLEFAGQIPVIETLNDQSAAAAVVKVVTSLPSGIWILPMLSLIALIFMATTYDSASYTLSACATQQLPADRHPARWHRVFWALSLGILPTALLMQGDLRALQSAVVVVSLPLIAVGALMCVALVQGLRSDRADSDFGT